jgi:uncharacterized protein (TIGR02265 family)
MSSEDIATGSPAYDWDEDLEQRLSLARPGDTVRGLFANGILKTVRGHEGQEAVERCLEACGERKFVDFFSYPIRTHLLVVFTAARLLAPRYGGLEGALRYLGRCSTTDFLRSATGRTMTLLARGEPRNLLLAMPSAYQVGMSFGKQSFVWTRLTSGRYILHRDFIPLPSHEGVLTALLEVGNARDVKVRGWRTSGLLDSAYEFSWR